MCIGGASNAAKSFPCTKINFISEIILLKIICKVYCDNFSICNARFQS